MPGFLASDLVKGKGKREAQRLEREADFIEQCDAIVLNLPHKCDNMKEGVEISALRPVGLHRSQGFWWTDVRTGTDKKRVIKRLFSFAVSDCSAVV